MEGKLYRGYFGNLYKINSRGFVLVSYDEGAMWHLSSYGADLAFFKDAIDSGAVRVVE